VGLMINPIKALLRNKSYRRRFERFECSVPASIHFLEDGSTIRGHVTEISQGGLKFKPNQTFIMRRNDGMVRLEAESIRMDAVIRNTVVDGYGLAFAQEIDDQQLSFFLSLNVETE